VRETISIALLVVGASFMLLGAVGVVRMPDLFTRMQAATKAAALGAGCMLIGVAVHFGQGEVTARSLLIVAFIFLTSPVSAHMIARAAYASGVPLWHKTTTDELRHRFDRRTGEVGSEESPR
jgi:multicomponent Na+:H+ antiporter subunit G